MDDRSGKLGRIREVLGRSVARMHSDDRGTALTEFVITLPIFIMVFAAIGALSKIEKAGVGVKVNATTATWSKAIPVQKSTFSIHMQPTIAGAKAMVDIGSHFSHPFADGLAIAKNAGLAAKGTAGESYAASKIVDVFTDLGSPVEGNLTMDAGKIVNNRPFPQDLVDDGTLKPVPSGSGPLGFLNVVLGVTGVKPAIAAGIRYGIVMGQASDSVSAAGKNFNLSAGYDVLVAPKPTAELWTVAVVRLTMDSYKPYNGMLGIEFSPRL